MGWLCRAVSGVDAADCVLILVGGCALLKQGEVEAGESAGQGCRISIGPGI